MVPAAIIGSSLLSSNASQNAANTQAQAAQQAGQVQKDIFERQVQLQEPWRQAGINALAQMQGQTNAMPEAFTGKVDLTQDPGYAFRMSEGMKALEHSAAARGGLLSGNMLKGTQRFGQDLASQEYQNAYNRALTQYNAQVQRESTGYNRLAALAGIGQTATGQLSGAASQYGSNAADAITSAAAARAAGTVGSANAVTGGLSTYLNYSQGQNLLNALQNQRLMNQYGAGNVYLPGGGASNAGLTWNGEP
jgi:hypothetical protein